MPNNKRMGDKEKNFYIAAALGLLGGAGTAYMMTKKLPSPKVMLNKTLDPETTNKMINQALEHNLPSQIDNYLKTKFPNGIPTAATVTNAHVPNPVLADVAIQEDGLGHDLLPPPLD